jgi:hypothetical protein
MNLKTYRQNLDTIDRLTERVTSHANALLTRYDEIAAIICPDAEERSKIFIAIHGDGARQTPKGSLQNYIYNFEGSSDRYLCYRFNYRDGDWESFSLPAEFLDFDNAALEKHVRETFEAKQKDWREEHERNQEFYRERRRAEFQKLRAEFGE